MECNVNRNSGHVRDLLSGLFYISKVVISNLASHADTGVFFIISKIFFDETMWIGPMVNGRSIVQMLLSYLVIPFYAATIYHFRRKGTKGLIISTVCLGISVLTDLMIPFMSSAVVTGITGWFYCMWQSVRAGLEKIKRNF